MTSGKEVSWSRVGDLEEMDAPEIDVRRLNAMEVLMPKSGEFVFPFADASVNWQGEIRCSGHPLHIRFILHEERSTTMCFWESPMGLNHQTKKRMTQKPVNICGVLLATICVVIRRLRGQERWSARLSMRFAQLCSGWTRVNFYAHDLSGKRVEFKEVTAMIKEMVVLLRQEQTNKLLMMITRTVG